MKTMPFFFLTLLFCLSGFAVQAQRAGSEEAAILDFWKKTWEAYDAGDLDKMWAAYTDEAGEISPDGTLTVGKANLKAEYEAMLKMLDEKPKFTYENPSVRILSPEFALVTWSSNADFKIGGQQVGGQTTGVAFLRKIKGAWKIEFDALAPVMQMPGTGN